MRTITRAKAPKNKAENLFCDFAGKDMLVVRRGWPDYLCLGKDNSLMAVEVKPNKHLILRILSKHGIPSFRYDPDSGLTAVDKLDEYGLPLTKP